jgi:hypothetical protein
MAGWALYALLGGAAVIVAVYASAERRNTRLALVGGLAVDYLLTPSDMARLGRSLDADFAVLPSGHLLLGAGADLYSLSTGDSPTLQLLALRGPHPQSLTADQDGTLLTVADGFFGMVNAEGEALDAVPLPLPSMRLVASAAPGVVYLFGGEGSDFRVYRFAETGEFQILLQTDETIVGVADTAGTVYVATPTRILRVDAAGPAVLLTGGTAELDGGILSLAATSDGGVLFSTCSRIYALQGGAALSVVNDSGGSLRLRGETLYVLDPVRRLLYGLRPVTGRLLDARS